MLSWRAPHWSQREKLPQQSLARLSARACCLASGCLIITVRWAAPLTATISPQLIGLTLRGAAALSRLIFSLCWPAVASRLQARNIGRLPAASAPL
jgi:hypothetical protein